MRIMILPGHSSWDTGAVNYAIEQTEHRIVTDVAKKLFGREDLNQHDIVFKKRNKSYSELPNEINSWNPELVIELHLNSASDHKVQGTEVLIAKGSVKGRLYGQKILDSLIAEYGFKNRGVKEIARTDRGATLLYRTKAPCVIVEAYFLSGVTDEQNNDKFLVDKYVEAIYNTLRNI